MTFDKRTCLFFLWIMWSLTVLGCGDPDDDGWLGPDQGDTASTDDSDSASDSDSDSDSDSVYVEITASCDDVVTDGTLMLTDETNYTFDSTIDVQDVTVKSATDLTFDWGSLSKDLYGKSLDPALDINMVLVALWGMTSTELAENLRNDNLPLSVNKGVIVSKPTAETPYTAQNLFNFTSPDGSAMTHEDIMRYFDTTAADYGYPQDSHTFMLVGASGTTIGQNSRMFGFFHLDPNAPDTTVALTDDSVVLDFNTNLAQIMPVPVPSGTGALNVSWEYITRNALGNEFVPTQITEVMIGHYSNLTRPQLDEQFLNLRDIADSTWSGEVPSGISIDLSTLTNDTTGGAFSGVDNTGVWLLALFCTKNCSNPAPWSITILQGC